MACQNIYHTKTESWVHEYDAKNTVNKSKNRWVVPYLSKKLLYNKKITTKKNENNKQNVKATYKMNENICKPCISEVNFQNI